MMASAIVRRNPAKTRLALIEAARVEFEVPGFEATNSNKIASRAGFAPQTFYRHFDHKLDIFLAVYERWADAGMIAIDGVRRAEAAAKITIEHHKKSLRFRRTLRHLSVAELAVRTARAASRRKQIEHIRARLPHVAEIEEATLLANLLMVERLSDACAEGEFADLGLSERQAETELARLMRTAFSLSAVRGDKAL